MDFLIHHMLRRSARLFPNKEAVVHGKDRVSYADIAKRCNALATSLRRAGIERHDRIGLFLSPSVPLAVSIFGTSQAGGVFVPVHHDLRPHQVAHIVNDCGIRALITDGRKLDKMVDLLSEMPSLEMVVIVGPHSAATWPIATYDYDAMCSTISAPLSNESIGKDLAAILYTSGSTGSPKGVMLSHDNILAGASIVSDYLEITEADRTLAALPFSFDAGLNQLMTAFQQGATCVLLDFLFANEIANTLQRERITGLAGVPTLWCLLTHKDALKRREFPDLRYVTNTGGRLPLPVLEKLRHSLPQTQIVLMYGLTEAFRSTYLAPEELSRRPESIGRAIPATEILVINESGQLCRPGEIGELVHHGPTVSLGYWGHPELTDRVLRPHPFPPSGVTRVDRVCYSGDLVHMDEDGFLYFVGRRDNLIKTAGFRVSPAEVEDALCKIDSVLQAAVVGVPDEVLGQRIIAFVIPSNGAFDARKALEGCREALPPHMIPKAIERLDAFPMTPSGKVDYPSLCAQAIAVGEPLSV